MFPIRASEIAANSAILLIQIYGYNLRLSTQVQTLRQSISFNEDLLGEVAITISFHTSTILDGS